MWVNQPTTPHLAKSPLRFFQPSLRSPRNKVVIDTDLFECPIHQVGHMVSAVPRYVFSESPAIDLAPGLLETLGQTFSLLKNLVRNRNGSFHTKSITIRGDESVGLFSEERVRQWLGGGWMIVWPSVVPRSERCHLGVSDESTNVGRALTMWSEASTPASTDPGQYL